MQKKRDMSRRRLATTTSQVFSQPRGGAAREWQELLTSRRRPDSRRRVERDRSGLNLLGVGWGEGFADVVNAILRLRHRCLLSNGPLHTREG